MDVVVELLPLELALEDPLLMPVAPELLEVDAVEDAEPVDAPVPELALAEVVPDVPVPWAPVPVELPLELEVLADEPQPKVRTATMRTGSWRDMGSLRVRRLSSRTVASGGENGRLRLPPFPRDAKPPIDNSHRATHCRTCR